MKIFEYLKEISDFLEFQIRLFVLLKLSDTIRIRPFDIQQYSYPTFWYPRSITSRQNTGENYNRTSDFDNNIIQIHTI